MVWIAIYTLGYFDFSVAWLATPLLLSVMRFVKDAVVEYPNLSIDTGFNQVAMEEGARFQAVRRAPRRSHQREGDDRVEDQSRGPPHLGILSRQGKVNLLKSELGKITKKLI